MGRLDGKVAMISGAGAGIGQGIAERFAAEGAAVGVLDIDAAGCAATADVIQKAGGRALAVACDVSDEMAVGAAVDAVTAAFGTIDVLVLNAAVMPSGRLHVTSPADFDRVLAVNLRGAYLLCRTVIPGMLALRRGSIIFMSSVTGLLGLPGLAAYSMTKGALAALARAMSTDYAAQGIRVNTVSPGTIDSPMLHDFLAAQSQPVQMRQMFDQMHPIGRVGRIDEVASVFVFLASDEASFVTGANYTVDGGLSVKGEQPQDSTLDSEY